MRLAKVITLLFLISNFFSSCCKEQTTNCSTDVTNTISSIESVYGCSNTPSTLQLNTSEEYKIITNSTDYNNFVVGSCHPAIDFSIYNLIIGTIHNDNNVKIDTFKYFLYQSCEPDYYKLSVSYKIDASQTGESFYTYHVLVPKQNTIQFLKITYLIN